MAFRRCNIDKSWFIYAYRAAFPQIACLQCMQGTQSQIFQECYIRQYYCSEWKQGRWGVLKTRKLCSKATRKILSEKIVILVCWLWTKLHIASFISECYTHMIVITGWKSELQAFYLWPPLCYKQMRFIVSTHLIYRMVHWWRHLLFIFISLIKLAVWV